MKTKAKQEQEKRDKKVYDLYHTLVSQGVAKMAANEEIQRQFGLYSSQGVYDILRREELRREGKIETTRQAKGLIEKYSYKWIRDLLGIRADVLAKLMATHNWDDTQQLVIQSHHDRDII